MKKLIAIVLLSGMVLFIEAGMAIAERQEASPVMPAERERLEETPPVSLKPSAPLPTVLPTEYRYRSFPFDFWPKRKRSSER